MNKHLSSVPRRNRQGFSLIELLVVITVIGVMASASVHALSTVSGTGDANRAISGAASALDLARQYAVSKNTYTWVIFSANPSSADGYRLYVATVASRDGTNTADASTPVNMDSSATYEVGSGTAAASNLTMIQEIKVFRGAQIAPLASSPAPSLPTASGPNGTVNFKLPASPLEAISYLNSHPGTQRIVQFSPTGQARVSGSISQVIELGLQPMKGSVLDASNVAAIQVNGFTGQTRVYRH